MVYGLLVQMEFKQEHSLQTQMEEHLFQIVFQEHVQHLQLIVHLHIVHGVVVYQAIRQEQLLDQVL